MTYTRVPEVEKRRGPFGLCGYVPDRAGGPPCGAPAAYLFRMRDWGPLEVGGACAEHVLLARQSPDVEWIRTYRP